MGAVLAVNLDLLGQGSFVAFGFWMLGILVAGVELFVGAGTGEAHA